jgi:hypothetical protein
MKEKYGSSLIGRKEELKHINLAQNPRELGRALVKGPQVLLGQPGWDRFLKRLEEMEVLSEEELRTFKQNHSTYSQKAMEEMYNNPSKYGEILAGIKAESGGKITDAATFDQAVNTAKPAGKEEPKIPEEPKPITDSVTAQKALASQPEAALAEQDAFKGTWNVTEIKTLKDALQKFPEQVQTALLSVGSDGKVDRGVLGILSQADTVWAANPDVAVTSDLDKAIKALPDALLKAIASGRGWGETTPLMAAIKAKAAATATTGTPPPVAGTRP